MTAARMRALLALPLVAGLAACDLAPSYHTPPLAFPATFKEQAGWTQAGSTQAGWKQAQPADDLARGAWWGVFADADLNRIEDQLTAANQNLAAAAARYDEARNLARAARAALYPSVDAAAGAAGGRLSQAVTNPQRNARYGDESLHIDFSYEIDVWGRVRNTARAAGAKAAASAADREAVSLSLHAQAADDYFTLRGYDTEIAVLAQTVRDYEVALQLTQARFADGYAAEPDVANAQTALLLARTQLAERRLRRADLEHAIAILAGAAPAAFSLPPAPLTATPPAIARVLPGSLLQRRPDIAAAERRVIAANAQIGATRAAFYPSFDLTSLIGTEARTPGPLFSATAASWAVGSSGVLNLFDGGKRRAANDEAWAELNEATATYRQTLLTAFGEVEDNLAALQRLAEEDATQEGAVTAAARARHQAELRYGAGYANYFDVVQAQNTELSARLEQADISQRRMVAAVGLIKALGGGWRDTGP